MKLLLQEIQEIKNELSESKEKLKKLRHENGVLKQAMNLFVTKMDELEQYGRRENIRIHGVRKKNGNKDDGEEVLLDLAKQLKIELNPNDVQRVHRLGKKRLTMSTRPRPVIARFVNYKKRNEFIYAKSKLKDLESYTNAFITEDLTLLRSKLLHYIKTNCKNFVLAHTINGKIRVKKSATCSGRILLEGEKDEGMGNWISINSPEDLAKQGENIDFKSLNYYPLMFNDDLNVSSTCYNLVNDG